MNDKIQRYQELLKQRESIEREIDSLDISEAKLFKFTGYFVDVNNEFHDVEDFQSYINNSLRCGSIHFFENAETDVEWHDDIDINKVNAKQEDYDEYFYKIF